MKKLLLIVLSSFFVTTMAFSQVTESCYDFFLNQGKEYFRQSEYQRAFYCFIAGKDCDKKNVRQEIIDLAKKTESCVQYKSLAINRFNDKKFAEALVYYKKLSELNPYDNAAKRRSTECEILLKPIPKDMVLVLADTFKIGSPTFSSENPAHNVILNSFYISKYEVTNAEFAEFLNVYGSDTIKEGSDMGEELIYEDDWGVTKDGDVWRAQKGFESHPVIYVSWFGADAYCKWKGYRLPTEAEWEVAARGGKNRSHKYAGSDNADSVAWYFGNSEKSTHAVGKKAANEIGLFDMSGNIYEWCSDWYSSYDGKTLDNPKGSEKGQYKVIRGGSWYDYFSHLTVTNRGNYNPDYKSNIIGFRCAKTP
jgi:formylglycine-generating enzyme required for sulfatase activity